MATPGQIDFSPAVSSLQGLAAVRARNAEIKRERERQKEIAEENRRRRKKSRNQSFGSLLGTVAGVGAAALIPGLGPAFVGPLAGAGSAAGRALSGGAGPSPQEALSLGLGFSSANEATKAAAAAEAERAIQSDIISGLIPQGLSPEELVGPANTRSQILDSGRRSKTPFQTTLGGLGVANAFTPKAPDFGFTEVSGSLIKTDPSGRVPATEVFKSTGKRPTRAEIKSAANEFFLNSTENNPELPLSEHLAFVKRAKLPQSDVTKENITNFQTRGGSRFGPELAAGESLVNSETRTVNGEQVPITLAEKENFVNNVLQNPEFHNGSTEKQKTGFANLAKNIQRQRQAAKTEARQRSDKDRFNFQLENGEIVVSDDKKTFFRETDKGERFRQTLPLEAVEIPASGVRGLRAEAASRMRANIELSRIKGLPADPGGAQLVGDAQAIVNQKDLVLENSKAIQDAEKGAGPLASIKAGINATLGGFLGREFFGDTIAARQSMRVIKRDAIRAFALNKRFPIAEQKQITNLLPDPDTFFTNPESEARKIPTLIDRLQVRKLTNLEELSESGLSLDDREMLERDNREIDALLTVFNAPGIQQVDSFDSIDKEDLEFGLVYNIGGINYLWTQNGFKQVGGDASRPRVNFQ